MQSKQKRDRHPTIPVYLLLCLNDFQTFRQSSACTPAVWRHVIPELVLMLFIRKRVAAEVTSDHWAVSFSCINKNVQKCSFLFHSILLCIIISPAHGLEFSRTVLDLLHPDRWIRHILFFCFLNRSFSGLRLRYNAFFQERKVQKAKNVFKSEEFTQIFPITPEFWIFYS